MTWRYRIRKRWIDGEPYFDVVEFYQNGCWTDGSAYPTGSTRGEVIRTLEMMLDDCKKTNSFTDKEKVNI